VPSRPLFSPPLGGYRISIWVAQRRRWSLPGHRLVAVLAVRIAASVALSGCSAGRRPRESGSVGRRRLAVGACLPPLSLFSMVFHGLATCLVEDRRRRVLRFGLCGIRSRWSPGGGWSDFCGTSRRCTLDFGSTPINTSPLNQWPVTLKYPLACEATPYRPTIRITHSHTREATAPSRLPRLSLASSPTWPPLCLGLACAGGATGTPPPTSLRRWRRPLRAGGGALRISHASVPPQPRRLRARRLGGSPLSPSPWSSPPWITGYLMPL
jgi:hypothetical protein